MISRHSSRFPWSTVGTIALLAGPSALFAQASPSGSSTSRSLPISVKECRSRTDAAFRSEGFNPGSSGPEFAFAAKSPFIAEFMCLQGVDGNTWALLFMAGSGRAVEAPDRDRLMRALESPGSNTNAAGSSSVAGAANRTACGYTISAAAFQKWEQVGGRNGSFGCVTSDEKDPMRSPAGSRGSLVWLEKSNGKIYHLTGGRYSGQAYVVQGPIEDKYGQLNGPESWLGFPISDEINDPRGRRSNFEGGYIIVNSSTGAATAYRNP